MSALCGFVCGTYLGGASAGRLTLCVEFVARVCGVPVARRPRAYGTDVDRLFSVWRLLHEFHGDRRKRGVRGYG